MKFQSKADVDLVTQTITFAAGSTSGWHAHPGVVLVTVASGSLVRGNHSGLVRNETTSAAVVYVTYLVPKGITALRIDKADPNCGPS